MNTRVELLGGLGNQLFAYFAGMAHSLTFNKKVDFNISGTNQSLNSTETIEVMEIPGEFCNKKVPSSLIQKIHPNYFVAQNLGFEESILLNTKFTSLNGYFQSYEYFEIFRGHLPNWEPRLKKYSKNFLTTKQELVHGREKISIHLRRGDYRKLKGSFGLLAHDYYIESVSSAINEFGNLDILIFGDEHDENLLLKLALKERGYESQVFQPKEDMLNIESMLLMSYCAVNIISNSTFGWWGARFNQNPSAIYAPSKWFKSLEDPHRLIPPNWICIDPVWIS